MSASSFEITTRAVLNALLDGKGPAYDRGSSSKSYAECESYAMAIAACRDAWSQVESACDPLRVTDPYLQRWERIMRITGAANRSTSARRAELAFRFSLFGFAARSGNVSTVVAHACSAAVPSVARYAQSTTTYHTLVSTVIPGGIDTSTDTVRKWSSGVSHITIVLTPPAWMSVGERDKLAGHLSRYLDDFLPAWCTWSWADDGPSGIGFFLDEANVGVARFA